MAAVYKSLSKAGGKEEDKSQGNGVKKNKHRVLILSSRGVTYRHRHLLNDLASMIPHGRKDAKFDSKSHLATLNELADLYNSDRIVFFEARKGKDLYIWVAAAPNGPTVKFHAQNIHTMEELNFTGNCLKGSRPILSFDSAFDSAPHLKVIRELFTSTFGVPQGARKSKPFIDRVMAFSIADGKIWVRNYQICEEEQSKLKSSKGGDAMEIDGEIDGKKATDLSLAEIGPRFILQPIIVQEGSFGGRILYENKEFVSPNQVRADLRRNKASRHNARAEATLGRQTRKGDLGLRTDVDVGRERGELENQKLFA